MAGIVEDQMEEAPGMPEEPGAGHPMEPPGQPEEGMGQQGIKDPLLQQFEQKMLEAVPDVRKSAVERFVLAGLKIMFDEKVMAIFADKFKQIGDPAEAVAQGIAALISHIEAKFQGKPMPVPAVIPAALILALHGLDFLAQAGQVQPSKELVASVTSKVMSYMMQKLGLTPEKVQKIKEDFQSGAMQQGQEAPPQEEGGLVQNEMEQQA